MTRTLSNHRRLRSKLLRVVASATVSLSYCFVPSALFGASTITYVQSADADPQSAQTSVSVTYTAAQVAGDLNVVAVGWNDSTATVSSVTDKSGNTYTLAVGPTTQSGVASQSIYYAKNIKAATAGANAVTVTFSTAAQYPDIRILEYSGADPNNPVDVTAASSGSSTTSSSGSATTTNATDLIFGANLVQGTTTGPGSGFTSRLLTSPDGDIAEDEMVSATGSYSATAPATPSGKWIMQMVAFRTPSGGTSTPTVTSVSPNTGSTAGGTAVTITGTNFATGATVTFGTAAATNVVVASSTSITATTPAGSAGAVTVTVTVSGNSGSLASGFTYVATPTVTSVSPNTGSTGGGTAVTITGTNFVTGATVTFGTAAATNVVVVSSTSITATTPAGNTGAVTVTVTVSGQSGSLASAFTYAAIPSVTSISPNSGPAAGGTAVTITGTNFATGATVTFGTAAATNVVVVSSTSITATTPAGTPGAVTVTVTVGGQNGSLTNGFTYIGVPTVTSVSPNSGSTGGGTAVTITGTNFATGATVTFGTAAATNVVVASSTSITATTPAGSTGAVTVTVTNTGAQSGSLANGFTYVASTTITYVQSADSDPQSPQTSVAVTFAAAQTAGDLNVVVVGWNNSTSTVSSVTDKSGNTYALAVGPTVQSGVQSQSIYYAKNIVAAAAGANIVTVTFSSAAAYPDIRILEYKGADPNNPVDVTAASSGSSATSSSGSATTTNATDLIFGANIVQTETTGPGSGFTSRLLSSPDGDIAEDEMVTTVGSYSATAPLQSGEWIMQMVAFRTPSGGVTPPTAPSNLTATPVGATQIDLSWTASTSSIGLANYIVERCQGSGCTSFAQVASIAATATTYNDTGLAASTSYSYRVQASDTSGNLSSFSNTATAVTGSSATPTAPGNITAVDGGPGPIIVGSQSYLNATALTTHTTAPFASTGGDVIILFASSHAGITFTPSDTYNNTWISISGPTSTTQGADLRSQVWYAPNPTVGSADTITMNLSTAEALVMSILVVKGSDIPSPIDAVSPINNDNGTETDAVVTPTVITSAINDLLMAFVKVSVNTTDNPGPGFTLQSGATLVNLVAETGPAATAGAYDATFTLNNENNWESVLVAIGNSRNQTSLSWSASSETGGTIAQYLVQRCQGSGCTNFAQIGTTTTTTYNDTGLEASTSYSYRVQAEDASDNVGPFSSVVSVTTPAPIPTQPTNLAAAADRQGPIILTWTASTGSLPISDYVVERCVGATCTNFAMVGTATGTTYTDSNVVSSTTYNYIVQAVDTAGDVSSFSAIATGTTVGSSPPTAPSNLTATAVSTTQIDLSWTASTSSIGLANYVVERCQGAGCTSFAQIGTPTGTTYTDTGLTPGATYSYEVEAVDIEGNVSPFSNVATATTGSSSPTTITYVQGAYSTPQTPQSSVSTTFTAAQAAGDLNVIVVGWNDSVATVSSVTDTSGNTYTLAVGPTVQSGAATLSIYYAKNIAAAAAGANIVTVTFSTTAVYPDIRILEYKGADPNNPVDVTAATTGTSATSSSGSATTTNPTDLIFGANIVQTETTGPGTGFTSRLLTSPDGDIAEDEMVTSTGSYSATAALQSGPWIMQMVAFRTPVTCSSAPPTTPTNLTATAVSSGQINLNWTGSTSCNGIAYYVVQRCQGTGCTNFATVGNTAATTYSDTGLTNSTSYSYQVQAVDDLGNAGSFSNVASATTLVISISPRTAALTFTRTQQFTSAAGVTWSVDGVVGGSSSTGTISTSGLYTPPSAVGTHTVTATNAQSNSASATVYITNYAGTYTYHNDNLRTGQNLSETVLTTSNVNQSQFGKLFSYPLDGIALASPLYVANVSIPNQGYHNVVYVATENDSVYAFDADGLSSTPLWHVSFLSSGVTTIPCGDTGECGDIAVQIGITGTPVIDPSSGTMYLVAATKEGPSTWVQRLHALDITTGAEKFGGPVVLQGSVPGTGTDSSGGMVPFDALHENQRTGLLLNNGVVYFAFGSHGDVSPWHGWVLGYNATTLQQTVEYNTTPNGNGGGIWHGGGGLATDTTGDIYYVTSNGNFDVNTGGVDYGDTVQKLSPSGTVVDYFTPHDEANMNANNLDLGAGGPVMLVDQTTGSYPHLLITSGKSGTIYVIDRDDLGGYNATTDNVVQSLPGVLPNGDAEDGNFSTPVYFNGYVYFGAVNDNVKAFQLTNGLLSTSPTSQTPEIYQVRGASFAISANSSSNGILWALQNNGASADNDVGNPGILYAYNANDLATELYNSSQAAGGRDTLDYAAKFNVPLVANGKVFIAGQSQLTAFGLLP